MSARRNIEVGPVRWKFIKSPSPREPYKNIKKLYEVELANSKIKCLSDLNKSEILQIKQKTRSILKKKYQKELRLNIISFSVILLIAILGIWILIK